MKYMIDLVVSNPFENIYVQVTASQSWESFPQKFWGWT